MNKQQKIESVKTLASDLKEAKAAVFVDYSGLGVKSQQELKKRLKEAGASMKVLKNTIISRAASDAGFPADSYSDTVLAGQTAVVLSNQDPVSPIQILGKFAKEFEKPQFKVGVLEGRFTDKQGLLTISKLPSKEILYAQVVGGLSAPMYGLVSTLQGNLQKLLWILQSKSN